MELLTIWNAKSVQILLARCYPDNSCRSRYTTAGEVSNCRPAWCTGRAVASPEGRVHISPRGTTNASPTCFLPFSGCQNHVWKDCSPCPCGLTFARLCLPQHRQAGRRTRGLPKPKETCDLPCLLSIAILLTSLTEVGLPTGAIPFPEYPGKPSHALYNKFDAASQRVSTTGEHAFIAPGPNDIRGPCAGLNAAANQ